MVAPGWLPMKILFLTEFFPPETNAAACYTCERQAEVMLHTLQLAPTGAAPMRERTPPSILQARGCRNGY